MHTGYKTKCPYFAFIPAPAVLIVSLSLIHGFVSFFLAVESGSCKDMEFNCEDNDFETCNPEAQEALCGEYCRCQIIRSPGGNIFCHPPGNQYPFDIPPSSL